MTTPAQFDAQERAEATLSWTGERCIPGQTDADTYYEHIHRYLFAAQLLSGQRVLDLGSGEGYGAALIAGVAESVIGMDVDPEAIAYSNRVYGHAKLRFVQGAAEDLSAFEASQFDAVVCFETIEHLVEHASVLENIRRVVRRGGLVIMSTPDRDIYTVKAEYHNPFHARELNRREFQQLLAAQFSEQALYVQGLSIGSIMRRVEHRGGDLDSDVFAGSRIGPRWQASNADFPYLVAVASDAPIAQLPALSLLHDNAIELIMALKGQIAAQEALRRQNDEWRLRYMSVTNSRTWRLTAGPRWVASRFASLARGRPR